MGIISDMVVYIEDGGWTMLAPRMLQKSLIIHVWACGLPYTQLYTKCWFIWSRAKQIILHLSATLVSVAG